MFRGFYLTSFSYYAWRNSWGLRDDIYNNQLHLVKPFKQRLF